ncbi:EscI/YscI/HrpB family type III secretion system inner rod protein [Pantoea sp. 18069]|uniref:EscI/YscI/HrpB family type III secretion system inner rod protein n=1 Tax=Pantoea sp. 18069 TaxID=2681415 RepID=UPI00135B183A|nr:EscI/YscI/HrpB family type III secretion system inner rod protein [Pantoea sp. 18069]
MEIIAGLASTRLEPTLSAAPAAAAPNAAAVQQFAALMQAPAPEAVAPAAASTTALATTAMAPQSFGDRVLHGMQNVSNDFRESWTRASETLRPDSASMDMQQMLSLQLHLTQTSVQYDLVGKAISRSTQNFDQLVRVQ